MPIFRSGPDQAPPWCEMGCFEILTLEPGQSHRFERRGRRELLLVAAGACRLAAGDAVVFGRRGALMELPTRAGRFEVLQTTHPTTLVHMAGRWDDTHGGAGLFIVGEVTTAPGPATRSTTPRPRGSTITTTTATSTGSSWTGPAWSTPRTIATR